MAHDSQHETGKKTRKDSSMTPVDHEPFSSIFLLFSLFPHAARYNFAALFYWVFSFSLRPTTEHSLARDYFFLMKESVALVFIVGCGSRRQHRQRCQSGPVSLCKPNPLLSPLPALSCLVVAKPLTSDMYRRHQTTYCIRLYNTYVSAYVVMCTFQ